MDLSTCYKWLSLGVSLGLIVLKATCEAATGGSQDAYLECYSCRAYQFEDDFRSKLSRCESAKTDETVRCPYTITMEENGVVQSYELFPSCTIVKQKAAGAITSYSRGCKYFTNCTNLDLCGESTGESGVCMSCCRSDLCNAAPSLFGSRLPGLWTLAAILAATIFAR